MSLNRLSNVIYWINERLDPRCENVFETYIFSRHIQHSILTEEEEKVVLNHFSKLGYDCMFVEFNDLINENGLHLDEVLKKLKLTTEYVEQSFIDDCLSERSYYRLFIVKSK